MNRIFVLAVVLLSLVSLSAGAQTPLIIDRAQKLAAEFTKDGLTIQTGIGEDGVQNLAVLARGGYFPLQLMAKAGVPTVLRMYTDRTYDCGRSFTLPELGRQALLKPKGVESFPLPAQKKGAVLYGSCGMGMYTFEIRFE